MDNAKPPSAEARSSSLFYIGRDSHGNWVVQDRDHLRGGLFVDRTQALKFALFENGHRPQAVVMVPGVFELDMTRGVSMPHHSLSDTAPPRTQRAA
jgi:hypothetical protein